MTEIKTMNDIEQAVGEQQSNLERVSDRIAGAIITFCTGRKTFHADDLRKFVNEKCGNVAPGSPDRVLRDLRQSSKLNYKVLSRSGSLYEVLPIAA